MSGGGGWVAVLDGVALSGNDAVSGLGCLTKPPDGLGLPELRTEDVVFPQRDGATHYSDWYLPRIVTLDEVTVCGDGCPSCPTGRAKVRDIIHAWRRRCDDTELVLFTDCHDPDAEDRSLTGPFGVIGRPRAATLEWVGQGSDCATMTLRFDAVDHRLYILDPDGEPGSGEQCVELTPTINSQCRTYDRCYSPSGMCYDTDISPSGTGGEVVATIGGTLCVRPTITLTGPLTNPVVEDVTTGQFVGYTGVIGSGQTIVIDLEAGTATEDPGGASRTYLLTGNTRMEFAVGDNTLRLTSYGSTDSGTADVCWRNQVDWA